MLLIPDFGLKTPGFSFVSLKTHRVVRAIITDTRKNFPLFASFSNATLLIPSVSSTLVLRQLDITVPFFFRAPRSYRHRSRLHSIITTSRGSCVCHFNMVSFLFALVRLSRAFGSCAVHLFSALVRVAESVLFPKTLEDNRGSMSRFACGARQERAASGRV